MLFVHKKSSQPISPWNAVRHGGKNNLGDPAIKGSYLLLWNFEVVQREGWWHYLFEFDVRDSLRAGGLARMVGEDKCYPDDMDWKAWLGPDFQVISAAVREEILNMPPDVARTGAVITGMREVPGPGARPIPNRDPNDVFRADLPDNFLLGLPGGS